MSAHILVVEDDPAIQALLTLSMTQNGYHVDCVATVMKARDFLEHSVPDLIVLDWMLPQISGLAFLRELKENPATLTIPTIMLTAKAEEYDTLRGLEYGADDYLTKPFSPRELNARIKVILKRTARHKVDDVLQIQGLVLDPNTQQVTGHQTPLHMSPMEFKLLRFFMTHPNNVHSRDVLLDKVWGYGIFITDRTVDVHIRRLRNILKQSGHHVLLKTVRGGGYQFTSDVSI